MQLKRHWKIFKLYILKAYRLKLRTIIPVISTNQYMENTWEEREEFCFQEHESIIIKVGGLENWVEWAKKTEKNQI